MLSESDRSVTDWLDALAAEECDRAVMLRGVADVIAANREEGWELLALVDQYYRRKKISAEDFQPECPAAAPCSGSPPAAEATPLPATRTAPRCPSADRTPSAAHTEPRARRRTAFRRGAHHRRRRTVARSLSHPGRRRTRRHGHCVRGHRSVSSEDGDSGQRVAIKVLSAATAQRPQLLEELRGEFQRLQALSHPNIVRVHDFDRDGDLTFFTMEHLSGASLGRVLGIRNSVALHRPHALSIIRQVGAAVAYAHSRGVVHGDLNPRNIFITDDGEIRVLDFGASHRLRPDPTISETDDPSRIAVATPSYASCETLVGRLADTRDDVYSLACIAYVLLRGRHPFHGSNALVARTKHLAPARPSGLSARQWRALKAGLQMDRKHRPESMSAWLDDLGLPPKPVSLPPLSTLANAQPPREGTRPGWPAA